MSEHEFQQEFIEFFRAAAPSYPQPVADYPLGDGKRFDLAWPEQHVAVGLASSSIILTTNEWTVLAFSPQHWAADSQDIIRRVRRALDA